MTALRTRMSEDMKIRNLAPNTQRAYLVQVSLFARHFRKSPDLLGREDIRAYQVYLTEEKELSPASIVVAVSALRFLYNVTLHRDWNLGEVIPAPKMPEKLPVILSPEEVLEFLSCVRLNHHRTILTCCYAAGLRISEALALQVPHIDSQRMMIRVELGKGHDRNSGDTSPQHSDHPRHLMRTGLTFDSALPELAVGTSPPKCSLSSLLSSFTSSVRLSRPQSAPTFCPPHYSAIIVLSALYFRLTLWRRFKTLKATRAPAAEQRFSSTDF